MRLDVELPGFGGVVLRGWLYLPASRGRAPAVVMAHGFSAVKEMALDRFGEAFARAGIAALVYDHRNLGASDGEPRQRINPWAQSRDYRYAISWLARRPEVDPERIAIWGSSFSGGEAIVVSACDERVKAVIASVPMSGLPGADYTDTEERFRAIRAQILDESGAGLADVETAVLGPFGVVSEEGSDLPVFLDMSEATQWFLRHGRVPGSTWDNRVTLANAFGSEPAFDPGVCIDRIAPRPLLMVVARDDRMAATEVALEAFARAGEPKQLVILEGDHFVSYQGEGFRQASQAMCDFLRTYL